jgi:hypothetical protein
MAKTFNTGGPCRSETDYMLPGAARLPGVRALIADGKYFVIHAPRQVGKTTSFIDLARELTESGRYASCLLSCETGAAFIDDPAQAEAMILRAWNKNISAWLPPELGPPVGTREAAATLAEYITAWCLACPRPIVLFLDEIDALANSSLISVLRQLRDGYPTRPGNFPHSLAIIGMRDVRDYKFASGGTGRLSTPSPFNIMVESLTIENFTAEQVVALYAQHTEATGQIFTPEASAHAWELTRGQPWLVNALARQILMHVAPDPATPITREHFDEAKERLIIRQDVHLDHLAERLNEPRVRSIIEPMMAGTLPEDIAADDRQYVIDLGLIRMEYGGLEIANPIYKQVFPRVLAQSAAFRMPGHKPDWLGTDGRIDPQRLLQSFLLFWRQHGQPLLRTAHYHEIAPHLVLMAWMHRVVNGGGTIEREYAIGMGRMDLVVRHKDLTLAIELKVWREGEDDPLDDGMSQLDSYLSGLSLDTGWLVIFDRREGLPPLAKRTTQTAATTPDGRTITVIRA